MPAPTKPAPTKPAPTCGACGADVRPPFRVPPSDASPDLDMRPGEPARGTLRRWINTCPFCEAAAPDLSRLTKTAKVVMASPPYFAIKGPRAAIPFLRWAQLCPEADRAEALLHAAWAADDAKDEAAARLYRTQSAACWPTPMPVPAALRLIDVLRRAADLPGATAQAAALDAIELDETAARILAYQRRLIEAGDTARHLLSSALPQPARRPHVAQQQPAKKTGFWKRLVGRA